MYAMFHNAQLDCLYLTARSLNMSSGRAYFQDFIANHADCFENASLENIQNLLCNEQSFSQGVLELISTFTAKKHLYLFVDLSVFNSTAPDAVLNLLELALQCLEGSIILSESSGARNPNHQDVTVNLRLKNLQRNSHEIEMKGFTEAEAEKYLTKRGSPLKYHEISNVSGNNPLLLSCISPTHDIGMYKGSVQVEVDNFLKRDLGELKSHSNELADYLKSNSVLKSKKFAYCACRGEMLDDNEVEAYKSTWLYLNCLTVLEVVQEKKIKVLEDQPESEETDAEVEYEGDAKYSILRWNFPTFGILFLDIITSFLTTSSMELVEDVCSKEPSFRGFWYEALFFYHHKQKPSSLVVDYTTASGNQVRKAEFFPASVMTLNLADLNFNSNTLYELRSMHPIIDSVGYLKDKK